MISGFLPTLGAVATEIARNSIQSISPRRAASSSERVMAERGSFRGGTMNLLRRRGLLGCVFAGLLGLMSTKEARANIFVTDVGNSAVGEYTNAGTPVNASLIPGIPQPTGVAVSGSDLFVASELAGTVGKYTTSGAPVNTSLISGLTSPFPVALFGSDVMVGANGRLSVYTASGQVIWTLASPAPRGIAVSGSDAFVTDRQSGTFTKLVASTGLEIFMVGMLSAPTGIAVSGSDLFVASATGGTIGEYDAATGALVNASLISGLNQPVGLAVLGSDLFVVNSGSGSIGEYTTSGTPVNTSLISGLINPQYLAVTATAVAEPGSLALLGVALAGLLLCRTKRTGGGIAASPAFRSRSRVADGIVADERPGRTERSRKPVRGLTTSAR